MIVVITACSARKDDSVPIPKDSCEVSPIDYLGDIDLIRRLETTRGSIFKDPRSQVGTKVTCAFDLYVRAGNAYRHLRAINETKLKEKMFSGELEWFFLSGGYGLIHALEPARKYQASFNRTIARNRGIPFTANIWKGILDEALDSVVSKLSPEHVYVFGSQDYTAFVKQTRAWQSDRDVTLFESTGSSGPFWLSRFIAEFVSFFIEGRLNEFDKKYSRFTKQ